MCIRDRDYVERHVWTWVINRATSPSNSFCSILLLNNSRVFLLLKKQPLLHDFSSTVSCAFFALTWSNQDPWFVTDVTWAVLASPPTQMLAMFTLANCLQVPITMNSVLNKNKSKKMVKRDYYLSLQHITQWYKGKSSNSAFFIHTTWSRRWARYAGKGIADLIKMGVKDFKTSSPPLF